MQSRRIRILDKKNHVVTVRIEDILDEIKDGSSFYWSILFLDSIGYNDDELNILDLQTKIKESDKGLCLTWENLNKLSKRFFQIIDLTLIGCSDLKLIHRYKNEQEMFETCDITISMFDSSYWEVVAKDPELIQRLATKFNNVTFLSIEET